MATKPVSRLDEARTALAESVEKMDEWDIKLQSLPEDAEAREIEFVTQAFEAEKRSNERWQQTVDRLQALEEARKASAARQEDAPVEETRSATPQRIKVGDEPKTYTPESSKRGVSFFRDVRASMMGDPTAAERLARHGREMAVEMRDLTTVVTDGGNFVPPQYLGSAYAEYAREARPVADVIPKQPLMTTGMSITIPRITTGTAVASQATENTDVNETEMVEALLTVPVRTIAGQQDVSRQLFDRTDPGIDQIIFNDLRADYDRALDDQLLNGAGTQGTHLGIRAVSSPNTVTFTTGSPTAALTVPKVYDAVQQIYTNRKAAADTIIMHPRRAAYLASNLSSTFPLFQQGQLMQANGTQDQGFVNGFAGLRNVIDSNVRTTDGASTNQDEMYAIRAADMILWEGPLQTAVYPEVGSGTLTVRLQLWAYSAFAAGRFPKSISIISGTGLTSPSF
jgi:HK97 family phage major capsid protein